jgi:hypothetical protein
MVAKRSILLSFLFNVEYKYGINRTNIISILIETLVNRADTEPRIFEEHILKYNPIKENDLRTRRGEITIRKIKKTSLIKDENTEKSDFSKLAGERYSA